MTISLLGIGCAPVNKASTDQASKNMIDSLGCVDMQSKVFDSFYELLDSTQAIPLASDVKSALRQKMNELKTSNHFSLPETKQLDQMTEKLFDVIDIMLSASVKNPKIGVAEQIKEMIRYEMHAETSDEMTATQTKLHAKLDEAHAISSQLKVACAHPTSEAQMTASNAPSHLSKGLNMVFATAYQSCRVLDLPAMDASSPSVVGITRLQDLPSGSNRVITNLKSVQNTHYYIRGIATEASCFPVREHPLIYDYAGVPAQTGNSINFFKNVGGSKELGIDCSAYVSSSIGVSGLRYRAGASNKPIYSRYTSSNFIDAKKDGFSCFDNVTVTPNESIKPGDILGVIGHVVMIDRIGPDPFGLNLLKTANDCSKIHPGNFDFTIAQSSPSKGGIGINKIQANLYLLDKGKMQNAFVGMAQQACLAKFQNRNLKPSSSAWGFLRHKGTPECLAPRTTMVGETCTQACL